MNNYDEEVQIMCDLSISNLSIYDGKSKNNFPLLTVVIDVCESQKIEWGITDKTYPYLST